MSMSDPIADMLTRVRNAIMVSYDTVDVPASKLKVAIVKILKSEGFIRNYKILSRQRQDVIRIFLKYDDRMPLEIALPALLALHEVEENVPVPVLLDVEEIRAFSRYGVCRKDLSP